ncbi:hypothetical protein [Mycoplasmopsis cynos]|uniref:hypothetical protein n=1 Tax=Mycoplasmopsis cynos TaxID=171284 RepID=UPI0024C856DB|nr:hypothetical protein [Mycoplasmopsis cynos]WAM07382.1 hypothetical protein ONA21_04250 [Mycoplasmopsis cynos]
MKYSKFWFISPKEGTKVQAVAELISNQDLKFVSVQEVSYENWSAIEKVIRVLKERYNKNYSFAKSPLKLFSASRPKSKESYAIIYDPTVFEEIDNKGLDKFEGKDIEFTKYRFESVTEALEIQVLNFG